MRIGVLLGVSTFAVAMLPSTASPCTCIGEWPSLKALVHQVSLAATAEVLAQGRLQRKRLYPEQDVAYLDVRIVRKLHGKEHRQEVRVWDPLFGSSCSNDLRGFSPGTYIAFAADRSSPESRELFAALEIDPGPDDYILGTCGTYYERLDSVEAAQRFPKKVKR